MMSDSSVLISVVIAVYNAEAYIRECLDSVCGQTYKDIEIICVDDGSTDSSAEIISGYSLKDNRVKLIKQQNQFAGVARNTGMKQATGEYIIFLDADDFFEPDMLEKAYEDIIAEDSDICVFNSNLFDQETEKFKEYSWAFKKRLFKGQKIIRPTEFPNNENIFRMFNGWAWDKLMKRSFVDSTGLEFQALRTSNDMYFTMMALTKASKISILDDVLAHQRVNNSSSLSRTREKSWNCFYEGLKAMQEELIRSNTMEIYERGFINWCANFSLWQLNSISGETFVKVYDLIRNEVIPGFGLDSREESYFFSKQEYDQIQKIIEEPLLPEDIEIGVSEEEEASDKPLVSVIMPSLNVGLYMEQCLRSVMAQTLKNIEIICVDAGSTDGTLEIIKQCASEDSRIRLIESEVKSYGVQMNMGLRAARADYIGIIETDDFAAADMYETLYSVMKSSGVDVVKANNYRIDVTRDMPSENLTNIGYNRPIRVSEHKDLLFVMPSIWNGLYRKEFLKENDIWFNETPGASYQDTGFIVKVWICADKVYLVRKPFYHYRTDNENSSVKSSAKIYNVCDEFESVEKFLETRPELEEKFGDIITARKYAAYHWNYLRLPNEFRMEFLYYVLDDLKKYDRETLANNPFIKPYINDFINSILTAPEFYFGKTVEPEEDPSYYDEAAGEDALKEHDKANDPETTVIMRIHHPDSRINEFIIDSVRSVQSQEREDLEIKVMASEIKDTTRSLIERLSAKDGRIDPNIYNDFESIVSASKGSYLFVMNAGDTMSRIALRELVALAGEGKDIIAYNGLLKVHKTGRYVIRKFLKYEPEEDIEDISLESYDNTYLNLTEACQGLFFYKTETVRKLLSETSGIRKVDPDILGPLSAVYNGSYTLLNKRLLFKPFSPKIKNDYASDTGDNYEALYTLYNKLGLFSLNIERDFTSLVIDDLVYYLNALEKFNEKKAVAESARFLSEKGIIDLYKEDGYYMSDYGRRILRSAAESATWFDETKEREKNGEYEVLVPYRAGGKPVVSVIIPVYNTAGYLPECIDSIIGQTFKDIEIICVNDGSPDEALDILKEYAQKDERIAVIDQENKGQSAARNHALEIAAGEYYYFMDSDDYVLPEMLEELIEGMKEKDLEVLFFEGKVFLDTEEGEEIHDNMALDNYMGTYAYEDVYSGIDYFRDTEEHEEYRVSPCMQILKADFVKDNGISFRNGIFYEDNLFTFNVLCKASRVSRKRKAYYQRRLVGTSTTMQTVKMSHVWGYYTCYREMAELIENSGFDEDVKAFLYGMAFKLLRNARSKFTSISPEEKFKYLGLPSAEYNMFNNLVVTPSAAMIDANAARRNSQAVINEKNKIHKILRRTFNEKSEINAKLQLTYKEKSELNAKLKMTYKEKSELNAKLQKTYSEKSERGVQIRKQSSEIDKLKAEIDKLKKQNKKLNTEVDKQKKQIKSLSEKMSNKVIRRVKKTFKK